MSAELRERLGDLADQVPNTPPPPDLWDRGRRYGRRRTLTQVAVASCCLLLLAVGVSTAWSQLDQPEFAPARGDAPVHLPDRLYNASPWLPGTDDEGPLGRLVAVIGAQRMTLTSSSGQLVGVSADTGEYRFLDLPGYGVAESMLGEDAPVLSSDGRWLAYLRVDDEAIVGLGAYDAATGKVRQHELASKHGIADVEMAWVGRELWVSVMHWATAKDGPLGGSSTGQDTVSWDPATGKTSVVGPWLELVGGSVQGGFVSTTEHGFRIVRSTADLFIPVTKVRGDYQWRLDVSLEAKKVAGVWAGPADGEGDAKPRAILVGDLPNAGSGGTTTLRKVPKFETTRVLGWRDKQHVLALDSRGHWVMSVDIETGAAERVTRMPDLNDSPGTVIAYDLLTAPVVDAKEPPRPSDPRKRLTLAAGVALGGLAGIVVLVRRRRHGRP